MARLFSTLSLCEIAHPHLEQMYTHKGSKSDAGNTLRLRLKSFLPMTMAAGVDDTTLGSRTCSYGPVKVVIEIR